MIGLIALTASVFYGLADFLGGAGARRAGLGMVLAISQSAALACLVAGAFLLSPAPFAAGAIGSGLTAGLGSAAALILLYKALARGPMAVVAPTAAAVAIVLPVLYDLARGAPLGWTAGFGVLVTILAIGLLGAPSRGGLGAGAPSRAWILTSFALAFAAGMGIALFYVAIHEVDVVAAGLWPLVVARTIALAAGLAWLAGSRGDFRPSRRGAAIAAAAGGADALANVLFLVAASHGDLTLAVTLASLYPATTALLALLVLRERVSAVQWLGLGLALCGAALISLGAG